MHMRMVWSCLHVQFTTFMWHLLHEQHYRPWNVLYLGCGSPPFTYRAYKSESIVDMAWNLVWDDIYHHSNIKGTWVTSGLPPLNVGECPRPSGPTERVIVENTTRTFRTIYHHLHVSIVHAYEDGVIMFACPIHKFYVALASWATLSSMKGCGH